MKVVAADYSERKNEANVFAAIETKKFEHDFCTE
jgi:hypothetical protein